MKLFIKYLIATVIAFGLAYAFYQKSGDFLKQFYPKGKNTITKTASNYRSFDQNISFSGIEKIKINTVDADINVHAVKENKEKIDFTSESNQESLITTMKVKNALIINVAKSPDNSSINITLPDSVKILQINTNSGDVNFENVSLHELFVHTISGDIHLKGTVSIANIKTVSGDVNIDSRTAIAGKIYAKSVSGDVNIPRHLATGKDMFHIISASGDINISID